MLVQGNVISYTPNTKVKKQGGGQYDAWELVYRSQENEVKTITKPATGLKFNPALKNALDTLSPGEDFTALLEKNANGYFDVKSIEKGIKEMADTPVASGGVAAAPVARGGKVTGSNYESAEERAKRQVLIVRQSSMTTALEILKTSAGVPASLEATVELAKEVEKHIYKDLEKAAQKYFNIKLEVF